MIPAQPKAGLGNFSRVFILGEFSVDGSEDRAWMGFWKNGRVGLDPGNSAPGGSPSEFMVIRFMEFRFHPAFFQFQQFLFQDFWCAS